MERQTKKKFIAAFDDFCSPCRGSLNPNISIEAVEEMILQHILTERIFRKIFDVADFNQRSVEMNTYSIQTLIEFANGVRLIKVKLRPLRLAFLVQPSDKAAISTAIETASFLWGGAFNPIVPVYDRLPSNWGRDRKQDINARSAVEGYLDTFDPDFVVKVGALESKDLKLGHREVIKCSEILASVAKEGTPAYGIGLFELLRHLYEKELKFVRHHPLRICLPKIATADRMFLSSVFGTLPEDINKMLIEHFGNLPGLETRDCSLGNYAEFLVRENLFIRRLGTLRHPSCQAVASSG